MPIPLIFLGAGAAAAASAALMNLKAKGIEEKVTQLRQSASEKRTTLLADWNQTKTPFTESIRDKKNYIETTYETCRTRSEPIFDRYGHALGDVSEWPMPPGFEKIGAMEIPPVPHIAWTEWENSDAYKKANDMRGMTALINGDIMKHNYVAAGGKAVVLGGLKLLEVALKRHSQASKFLSPRERPAGCGDYWI